MNIVEHLKSRHLDLVLHRPMLNEEENIATFLLWNLSGQIVGFQRYNPLGDKKVNNNPYLGKYFTYNKQPTLAVWGVESLHLTPHVVFICEGIFDAARLTERGFSALAVLANNPRPELRDWLTCLNRKVVAVCDNDVAGRKLAKFGDEVIFTEEKDLGDSSDEFVSQLLSKYSLH